MKTTSIGLRIVALLALTLIAGTGFAADPGKIKLKQVYAGLETTLPVEVTIPNDGSGREFLVLQGGKIIILPKNRNAGDAKVFLDISGRNMIEKAFEEGLLSIAFHPQFKKNGKFYLYYTMQDPKQSQITEMRVSKSDPDKADLETERVLLVIPQPFWNHNSGNMLFGPDGMLYIFSGDGGKRDDPLNLAQNLFSLKGKVLRIDVDSKSGNREYGIPEDNPYVGMEGKRPEVWASGLRNPWGVWFDPQNGDLWCADVGQDLWEEIDLIVKGGNYGWSYREGARNFAQKKQIYPEDADFIEPIHEYSHIDGLSITGGFIYRGKKHPQLKGRYIYGDFNFGKVWALKYDRAAGKVAENHLIYQRVEPEKPKKGAKVFKPTAFCEDADGEILVLSHDGKVYAFE